MKKHLLKPLLALALVLVCGNVWGEMKTVTYAQSSTVAASVTKGIAPSGSSVTFKNTYSTKEQLTGGNSMTYTLSGYAGYVIKSLTMSMHSNKSSGTGRFSFKAGETTLAEISSNTGFNQLAWNGAWTQSYTDVTPNMLNTNYTIQNGEDVVLTITASGNSLFCQSVTIEYDNNTPIGPVDPTITTTNMSCGVSESFDVSQMFSSNSEGTISYSVEGANAEDYDLDGSEFLSEVARTYTIKASQAADDDKYNAGEATAILTVLGKFTVNYYSLGVKIGTEEVYDGQSVANAPEVTNVPTGWSFIDWTTNDAYKQSATAPSFFDGVVKTDINLFAVFGKREGQISLTKMKADDSLSDGDNIVIVARLDNADENDIKGYALYQETIGTSYVSINKYPFVEDAELIAADEKNWLTVNMKADGFSLGDKKNGYIYSVDNNLHCGETEQIWTISTTEDGQFHLQSDNRYLSYRYDLSTNKYWRMGGASLGTSGQTTLDIYKFVAGTFAYATTFAQSQNVTISNVGFATAFMGFDATVSGADAFYVTVSDGVANLTKVEGVIPANTGVVLEAHNVGETTAKFRESVATADDKAAAEGNMLKGTLYPDGETFNDPEHTYYALRNGEHGVCFYWDPDAQDEGASAKCACGKAILDVPSKDSAPSSSIGIRFDGASLIVNTDLNEEKCYHDFLGHKVEKPSTGLYIVSGKKILVK